MTVEDKGEERRVRGKKAGEDGRKEKGGSGLLMLRLMHLLLL